MTFRRFLAFLILAIVCEVGVFAASYQDLLFLRQPSTSLLASSPVVFEARADQALRRKQLTRQHLDTIATTARAFNLPGLERRSLERAVKEHPSDIDLRLRLADAMRRGGELVRAEHLFQSVLNAVPEPTR
jgi:uncharacterized protein with von Willebrand factor type A (vWA) domain